MRIKELKAGDWLAIIGIILILLFAFVALRNAMSPEESIRYMSDVCASGCRGSANFDVCFQACMFNGQ